MVKLKGKSEPKPMPKRAFEGLIEERDDVYAKIGMYLFEHYGLNFRITEINKNIAKIKLVADSGYIVLDSKGNILEDHIISLEKKDSNKPIDPKSCDGCVSLNDKAYQEAEICKETAEINPERCVNYSTSLNEIKTQYEFDEIENIELLGVLERAMSDMIEGINGHRTLCPKGYYRKRYEIQRKLYLQLGGTKHSMYLYDSQIDGEGS